MDCGYAVWHCVELTFRNLSGEDMMHLLKTALLKRTGMEYYGYILIKCLRETGIRDLNVTEYKEKGTV